MQLYCWGDLYIRLKNKSASYRKYYHELQCPVIQHEAFRELGLRLRPVKSLKVKGAISKSYPP